ncbi:hypothetical protein [Planococcus salinarum]|uniref:hypothetical protein n=1 Tax=Planococcus salinarum TaxID=622695 RepID=UPI000E3C20A0|nr:hypothetical protein [Planococcus salinarum]TAA73224.1 hypothetical protein D2909_02620 [Planococcus salinarum]
MKYLQYKGVVEREYKMSLKKIMHQLCVTENLNAVEGAKKLRIAKEIFVYWRQYFRLEKRQILFDQTVEELAEMHSIHFAELESSDTNQRAGSPQSGSLEELEDVVDSLIKYYEYIHYTSEGLSLKTAKLPLYKFSRSVISDYKNGELEKELHSQG